MGLLDIFKNKKEEKFKKEVKAPIKRAEKKVEKKAEKPVKSIEKKSVAKKEPVKRIEKLGISYKILKHPHISEKSTDLEKESKYVFRVFPRANKVEIKKSIEDLYGVRVLSVRIVNIHRKKKRLGRTLGFKQGYKKAIIKLAKGEKIEVLPR